MRQPIKCIVTDLPANKDFIESQCWVRGPFYHPQNESLDKLSEKNRLKWYPYTQYILFLAAILMFAPHSAIKSLSSTFTTKFESIHSGVTLLSGDLKEEHRNQINDRIHYHLSTLETDKYYLAVFIFFRFVYLFFLAVVLPIFLSIAFNANFYTLGARAAFFFYGDNYEHVKVKFPIFLSIAFNANFYTLGA